MTISGNRWPSRVRQILLAKHPESTLQVTDMAIETAEFRPAAGEVVTRTTHISVDPYLALNMRTARQQGVQTPYLLRSRTIGEVIDPGRSNFAVGDHVLGFGNWREFDARPASELRQIDLQLAPPHAHLGALGHSGFTAWLGLFLGEARAGETVLISGAAGAVGSAAGVLARRLGCRVVGIAGSDDKTRWLTDELGFHAAVNYREPDFAAALGRAAPEGYDLLFENVGTRSMDPALLHLKRHSRIMLCGLIQHYQSDEPLAFANFKLVLRNSVRILPFTIYDHDDKFETALSALLEAWQAGDLKAEHTLSHGFDNVPRALVTLFEGKGRGKHLVQVG